MRQPARRIALWVLAAASSTVIGLSAPGCDALETAQYKADRRVEEHLQKSKETLARGGQQAREQSLATLGQAAGEAEASSGAKTYSKALLAQTEMELANSKLRDLERMQLDAHRLMWEIAASAAQIDAANHEVASQHESNPKPVLQQIAAKRGEISADLSKVADQITALQTQLGDLQRNQQDLKAQQDRAAAQAANLFEKSYNAQGQESVDLFTQATQARQQAGVLGALIEELSVNMAPVQRELAIAQGHKKLLQDALLALDDQKKQQDAGWQAITEQLNALGKTNEQIASSISEKSAALAALFEQMQAPRKEATGYLSNASQHYREAGDAAAKFASELNTSANDLPPDSPLRAAYKAWQGIQSQPYLRVEQAHAQHAQALVHADLAKLIARQRQLVDQLTPIYQKASLAVPTSLVPADLEAQLQQERDQAEQLFAAADETLASVGSGTPEVTEAAHVARMLVLYGRYQLTEKAEYLEAAKSEKTQIPNLRLVAIPDELKS